ncbi:uncharacterized protein LOC132279631 [Cornus florida]|uniref:uncharacterized protein LOC132279631 n=1 Tax=Cornus florida TaxID=4283 RepID=UPI002897850A|nr:uncharacterized protein LOC132279631 [Cornus florida]
MMSLQETDQMKEMEFQELHQADEVGGFESSAVNRLNMLSLNGVQSTTAANGCYSRFSAASVPSSAEECTMCGSMKRRSPSSSSLQEQQPNSKKLNLQPPPSTAADNNKGGGKQFHGFTRIPLPSGSWNVSSPYVSMPILRRCSSDIINSPGNNNVGAPKSQPSSPENAKTNVSATTPSPQKASASLPPLPPTLRRTVSDPTSAAYQVMGTPPPPPSVARTFCTNEMGLDSVKGESPESKRLKRMKACMRGMRQWWDEVLLKEEEEDDDGPEDSNTPNAKSSSPDESEGEAVSVERNGEWLVIKFQCPCSKGYQLILCADSCYYKLM